MILIFYIFFWPSSASSHMIICGPALRLDLLDLTIMIYHYQSIRNSEPQYWSLPKGKIFSLHIQLVYQYGDKLLMLPVVLSCGTLSTIVFRRRLITSSSSMVSLLIASYPWICQSTISKRTSSDLCRLSHPGSGPVRW